MNCDYQNHSATTRPAYLPERWKDRQGGFYDFRACWTYRDAAGEPIGVVARYDSDHGKQVIPYFKPHNGHAFKAGGPMAPVLFGRDTLKGHDVVFVVEGEKCAAALHSLGLVAVSAQGGSNKAAGGDWPALAGVSTVYLLPDHDAPGERYAKDVVCALARLDPAPTIKVVRLPVDAKQDAVDWLSARVPDWDGFGPLPEGRRGDLARELLTLAEQQGEPPPDGWQAENAKPERPKDHGGPRLRVKERGDGEIIVPPCLQNAVYLLSETAEWRGVIAYNQFRQRIEKRQTTPYKAVPGPWSDWDTAETIVWLSQKHNVHFSRETVDFAALAVANRNAFNPAQERLRALSDQWDEIPRLAYWLEELLDATANAENRAYLAEIGAAWLKGVVARVLFPGCKHDDVLVLRSQQGWRKSTAAQAIADAILPDAFTDSVDLGNLAEAKIQIRGVIIAELGELAGMGRAEVESVKAFVSTKSDHFREKFGRHAQDFLRTCSFIGTTNDSKFLRDPTGNRRWWPVTLEGPIDGRIS